MPLFDPVDGRYIIPGGVFRSVTAVQWSDRNTRRRLLESFG